MPKPKLIQLTSVCKKVS